MGNFHNWLLTHIIVKNPDEVQLKEARTLFGMRVNQDPAFTHAVTFDKAFADSDDSNDKDIWMHSVRETAGKFTDQIDLIIHQMGTQGNDAYCYATRPTDAQAISCESYLANIRSFLARIANYHFDVDSKSLSDVLAYKKESGFGLIPHMAEEYFNSSINSVNFKHVMKESVKRIVDKIGNWIVTIANKGVEGKSDIHRHLFKNYDNQEIIFAKGILDSKEKLNGIAFSMKGESVQLERFKSLLTNLIDEKLPIFSNLKRVIGWHKDKKTVDETILQAERMIASIDSVIRNSSNSTDFAKQILIKFRNGFKNLVIALHRKHGELKD